MPHPWTNVQGQVGWGLQQPGLAEGLPATVAGGGNKVTFNISLNPNYSMILCIKYHLLSQINNGKKVIILLGTCSSLNGLNL